MARRLTLMLSVFVLLTSALSLGQDATSKEFNPRFQVFGGYSLERLDTGGLSHTTLDTAFGAPIGTFGIAPMFSGFDSGAQFKLNRLLGIAADFSGNYGKFFAPSKASGITGLPKAQSYSALVGPVATFTDGKVSPFVHALFGVNRLATGSTKDLTELIITSLPSSSNTAFATALGAGMDVNFWHRLGVRIGQVDYLITGHDMNAFANRVFVSGTFVGLAKRENNLRVSTGFTYRF